MKKILSILLLAISFSSIKSMSTLEKYLGFGSTKAPMTNPYDDKGIDNVAFWSTVEQLLEKQKANPEFIRHAKTQLRRAQTLGLHERGLSKTSRTARGYSTVAIAKEREKLRKEQERLKEELKKAKAKRPTESQKDAFERGKKAGQAKQRRIFKKKAEEVRDRIAAQKKAK